MFSGMHDAGSCSLRFRKQRNPCGFHPFRNGQRFTGSGSAAVTGEVSAVSSAASDAGKSAEKKHILVAYFSQVGEQYGVGVVEKATRRLAEMIADETGS